MPDCRSILKTMIDCSQERQKVPVASQSVKAKTSAKGGLDRKFGYHSRLPILETIRNFGKIRRL
jgi:hypothetical protein